MVYVAVPFVGGAGEGSFQERGRVTKWVLPAGDHHVVDAALGTGFGGRGTAVDIDVGDGRVKRWGNPMMEEYQAWEESDGKD